MSYRVGVPYRRVTEENRIVHLEILAARIPRISSCAVLVASFLLNLLLVPAITAFQSPSPDQAKTGSFHWLIRDDALSGWEHRDNWSCDGKSVVCSRYSANDSARNRISWKDPLPTDFELVFEWQETKPRPIKYACPGLSINYDSRNGTQIDYQVGNLAVRIQSVPPEDGSGIAKVSDSWSTVSNAIKDYSQAVGGWNKAGIRCVGHRIQFSLNDVIVFDVNLEDERHCRNDGDIRCKQLAIERWCNRKLGGVYLGIVCYHTDPSFSSLVRLRSLGVRHILDVGQSGLNIRTSGGGVTPEHL